MTINSISYVCESASFTYGGNRVDLNDSNGEPLASCTVPGRVEGSMTLQYGTDSAVTAPNPTIGQEIVTSVTNGRNNSTYIITEVGDAQSQGDYAKLSVSFYEKIN